MLCTCCGLLVPLREWQVSSILFMVPVAVRGILGPAFEERSRSGMIAGCGRELDVPADPQGLLVAGAASPFEHREGRRDTRAASRGRGVAPSGCDGEADLQ